jgi:hypothetical protein
MLTIEFRMLIIFWTCNPISFSNACVLGVCYFMHTKPRSTQIKVFLIRRIIEWGCLHEIQARYKFQVKLRWVYTRVQDQRNPNMERFYWSRAKFETQEVYTRVGVQGVKIWCGTSVTSVANQILVVQLKKLLLLVWEINLQAWVQSWVWK